MTTITKSGARKRLPDNQCTCTPTATMQPHEPYCPVPEGRVAMSDARPPRGTASTVDPCPVCGAVDEQRCFTVTPSDPRQEQVEPHPERVAS